MIKFQSDMFGVIFAIVITLLFSMFIVTASHNSASYEYLIGTGFLEEFGDVMTKAPNGDTIELKGSGTFTIGPKSITGNGTFIHRDAEGNILGTGKWVATKLISFKSYGSGAVQGLPEDFEGGRALIKVILDPDNTGPSFEGTLRVTCLLGDKIPTRDEEGIRLAVRGIPINFNKEMGGATLFIRKDGE